MGALIYDNCFWGFYCFHNPLKHFIQVIWTKFESGRKNTLVNSIAVIKQSMQVNDFVRNTYFDMKLSDQGKAWVPHIVCKTCFETLYQWSKGIKKTHFGIPMIWRELRNYVEDCYFNITPAHDLPIKPNIKPDIPTWTQPFYQLHIQLKFLYQYL